MRLLLSLFILHYKLSQDCIFDFNYFFGGGVSTSNVFGAEADKCVVEVIVLYWITEMNGT